MIRRFKPELVKYLPATADHYVVGMHDPFGALDNQQHIAGLYPSRRQFDEYFLFKMTYHEKYQGAMSNADKILYREKFLILKQGQLDT